MILKAVITEKDAGRLIKHFVRGTLGVSYGQFNSLKMRGGLMVNGEVVHANHKLSLGETVEVLLDEQSTSSVEPAEGPVDIRYEDDDILIINKPAPLACQASARNPEPALENRLTAKFGPEFVFRPLNRLDKGTSGLLCAAKHATAARFSRKRCILTTMSGNIWL